MKLSSFATIATLSFFLLVSSVHADLRGSSLHAADTAEEHEQQDRRTLGSVCTDSPVDWTDSYTPVWASWSCAQYEQYAACAEEGNSYPKDGVTANEACCTCGGGVEEDLPVVAVCPVDPILGASCDWPVGTKCGYDPICCNGSDQIYYATDGAVCENWKIVPSQHLLSGYINCGGAGYKESCF